MDVNFIVCDDSVSTLRRVERLIFQSMVGNKLAYETHLFEDYNDNFLKIVNSPLSNKIYILDIETPTRSGIDIARRIRSVDVNSIIIFLTGHEELGLTILKNELMFLSFINKYDDYEIRMIKSIKKALEMLKVKNTIRFEESGVIYTICIDDVLYVTKDNADRKSIIKTVHTELKTYKSLIELNDLFGGRFIKTHKSCIVNSDRVVYINKPKRLIKFNNGETIDLLSSKYKKELSNLVL